MDDSDGSGLDTSMHEQYGASVYSMQSLVDPQEQMPLQDKPLGWWKSIVEVTKPHERLPGKVIMGKMSNETLKAELGRSAWRLLHTMAGKFPYNPTKDEQTAIKDFIYLFARLYPCGDCASHFKIILQAHPPIVTDREALSQWACTVHNVVNKRLHKPIFDCSKVGDMWKCGCDEDGAGNSTISATDRNGNATTIES
ncbi:hypothetical protein BDV3_004509 [Batrachochytrium dendrobatidis]|uniref:Sulfhydryl oxidase n=1 Tax=Batrachochytrium dendrobatidis (strain JEL423) TaxID=403673 RepID=A0A177WG56_BATDL|nr:hypothetical protein O5D80_006488 [Batrachochytrium dendrobatidis]KAK5672751.1 hypothetical protein QVD99_000251 [Batrachochytrium dendrobatidis]OAJ39097.1 hypothetical protein BDEG_22969 [Batrachochytrium dendrobatidis JEL423]